MAQIGFLGAGRMGRPMVLRLVGGGHTVRVHDRSGDKADLASEGVELVREVTEVAAGADAVVVNLFSDEQVRQLVLEPGGLADAIEPGATLILHTTSSPRTSEELETRLAARGAFYVDAAVSGGPQDIAIGKITLFIGGSGEAFAKAEQVLRAYGSPVFHFGPAGTGMKVKLLNNAAFGAHIGVVSVLADLARTLHLDEEALFEGISYGSGNSSVVRMVRGSGGAKAFSQRTAEFVDKDIHTAQELLGELGVNLDPFAALYQAGRDIRTADDSAIAQAVPQP